MEKDLQAVNLKIHSGLWRRVKSQSALEGKTVTLWVVEALVEKLKEKNG